jgi:hypothetical protein
MAIIPTFDRQVQFSPQPITSSATTFTALSAAIGGVEKVAESSIAKQKQEALETSRFMTGTDIIKQSSKIFEDSQKQPDKQLALDQYKNSYQSYSDSLLAQVPKENKLYAERMLFSLGNQGAKKFQQQIAEQGKLAAVDEFNQTVHALTALTTNEASTPTINSQKNAVVHGSQIMTAVQKAVGAGIKTPEGGATILKSTRQEIEGARIEAYGKAARAESQKSFEKFKQKILTDKSYNSIYSPDERKALVRKLDADAALDTQRLALTKQQVSDMDKDLLKQASLTGKVNSTELSTRHEASPATFGDFNKDLQLSLENGSIVSANKHAPLSDQFRALAESQRPLTKEELLEPGIDKKLQYRAQRANALSKNIAAFKENPSTSVSGDPEYQAQNEKLKNNTIYFPETDPRYASQVQKYLIAQDNLNLSFQTNMGLKRNELSLIDGPEAQAMATHVNGLEASQIIPFTRGLEQRYGENTNLVMKNLRDAGAKGISNWLRGIDKNPKSAPHAGAIVEGFQLGRAKALDLLKPTGVSQNDITNSVNTAAATYFSTIHATNGDTLDYQLKTRKDLELATMGIMIKEHKGVQEASQIAVDSMINNHYQYVSFTPGFFQTLGKATLPTVAPFFANKIGSGSLFRIPKDADPVSYMKAANAIYVNTTLNPPGDLIIPKYIKDQFSLSSPAEQREIYINDSLKNGTFINNNDDNGIVLVDRNGVPVRTETGGTIGMLHDDLKDPSSDAYKQIAQLEQKAAKISERAFQEHIDQTVTPFKKTITQPLKGLESFTETSVKELSRASRGESALPRSDLLSESFKQLIKPRNKK